MGRAFTDVLVENYDGVALSKTGRAKGREGSGE